MTDRLARFGAFGTALSLPRALLVSAAVMLVALAGVTYWVLSNAYRDEVASALRESERTAQLLAAHVRGVLDQVDQTTQVVKFLFESRNPIDLQTLHAASLAAANVAVAVLRTDAEGSTVDHTGGDVPGSIALDEDFKYHSRFRDNSLTLGRPSPSASDWRTIPALRRLSTPEGGFAGVVVAQIDPTALLRGFDRASAATTALGLIGSDNVFRARLVNGKLRAGDSGNIRTALEAARQARERFEPSVSPVDGTRRFVTVVPIDRYLLYALVAASADDVTATYVETRRHVLAWAGAMALVIVVGALLLARQARHLNDSQRAARRAEALYRAASEGGMDALFMLKAERGPNGAIEDFVFSDANSRGLRLLRQTAPALIGTRMSARLPKRRAKSYLARCAKVVDTGVGFELEFRADNQQLEGDWLHVQVVPLEGGIAVISRDVTAQKTAQLQLAAMARLDPLTGLANRRHFEEHLERAAARAKRSGKPLALVYLDLDGFKRINDLLGHDAGDRLLVEVAKRLKASIRATDLVSRLGGDEFTVLLEDSGTAEDRLAQCERILDALSQPHVLQGKSVFATPSIGVAVYRPGEPLEDLRRRADRAMYEAKSAGKACLRLAPLSP